MSLKLIILMVTTIQLKPFFNDALEGFRSKASPVSLTGVLLEQFFKGLNCYLF
jgi:hypothetical protein